jgi:hypothetical protein
MFALVGFVSHNELSVHGHEWFKTNSHDSAATFQTPLRTINAINPSISR